MSNPITLSCPEHDAIAQLIRRNDAQLGRPSREDILFEALAAVDGVRYVVEDYRDEAVVIDRWATTRLRHIVAGTAVTPDRDLQEAHEVAAAEAAQRNNVNVAARAQELQDEIDGRTR